MQNIVGWIARIGVNREHKVSLPSTCLCRNTRKATVIRSGIGNTRHLGLETEIAKDSIEAKTFVEIRNALPETLLAFIAIFLIQCTIINIHKDWIDIHQAVIRIITSVTRIDINLVVSRIGRSCTLSLAFHLVEQSTIWFLQQARQFCTNRLLSQIQLHQTNLSLFSVIHNATGFGIYIRIVSHFFGISQLLTLRTIYRSNNDIRGSKIIAIVLVIHTYDIIIAKPYWRIDITHIDNFFTIKITYCCTELSIEKNHSLVWRQRRPNVVNVTMRFEHNLFAIAIEVEIQILVINTES